MVVTQILVLLLFQACFSEKFPDSEESRDTFASRTNNRRTSFFSGGGSPKGLNHEEPKGERKERTKGRLYPSFEVKVPVQEKYKAAVKSSSQVIDEIESSFKLNPDQAKSDFDLEREEANVLGKTTSLDRPLPEHVPEESYGNRPVPKLKEKSPKIDGQRVVKKLHDGMLKKKATLPESEIAKHSAGNESFLKFQPIKIDRNNIGGEKSHSNERYERVEPKKEHVYQTKNVIQPKEEHIYKTKNVIFKEVESIVQEPREILTKPKSKSTVPETKPISTKHKSTSRFFNSRGPPAGANIVLSKHRKTVSIADPVEMDDLKVPRYSKMVKNNGLKIKQLDEHSRPVETVVRKTLNAHPRQRDRDNELLEKEEIRTRPESGYESRTKQIERNQDRFEVELVTRSKQKTTKSSKPKASPKKSIIKGFRIKGDKSNSVLFLDIVELGFEQGSGSLKLGSSELIPVDENSLEEFKSSIDDHSKKSVKKQSSEKISKASPSYRDNADLFIEDSLEKIYGNMETAIIIDSTSREEIRYTRPDESFTSNKQSIPTSRIEKLESYSPVRPTNRHKIEEKVQSRYKEFEDIVGRSRYTNVEVRKPTRAYEQPIRRVNAVPDVQEQPYQRSFKQDSYSNPNYPVKSQPSQFFQKFDGLRDEIAEAEIPRLGKVNYEDLRSYDRPEVQSIQYDQYQSRFSDSDTVDQRYDQYTEKTNYRSYDEVQKSRPEYQNPQPQVDRPSYQQPAEQVDYRQPDYPQRSARRYPHYQDPATFPQAPGVQDVLRAQSEVISSQIRHATQLQQPGHIQLAQQYSQIHHQPQVPGLQQLQQQRLALQAVELRHPPPSVRYMQPVGQFKYRSPSSDTRGLNSHASYVAELQAAQQALHVAG